MQISVICPHCKETVTVEAKRQNEIMPCPSCGRDFLCLAEGSPYHQEKMSHNVLKQVFRNPTTPGWVCAIAIIGGIIASEISLEMASGELCDGSCTFEGIAWLVFNFASNLAIYAGFSCLVSKIRIPRKRDDGYHGFRVFIALLLCVVLYFVWMGIRAAIFEICDIKGRNLLWPLLFFAEACRGIWRLIVGVKADGRNHNKKALHENIVFCPKCGTQQTIEESKRGGFVKCIFCQSEFFCEKDKPNSLCQTTAAGSQKQNKGWASMYSHEESKGHPRINNTQGYVLCAGAIVLAGVIGAIAFYMSTRYQLIEKDHQVYRVDSHTGELMLIKGEYLQKLAEPEKIEPKRPRALTEEETSVVEGSAGVSSNGASYTGTLYNGNTDVTVSRLTIAIRWTNRINQKDTFVRRFKCEKKISPLKTVTFFVDILPVDEQTYKRDGWWLEDVYGVDEK